MAERECTTANEMAEAIAAVADIFGPVAEAAKGMRDRLERDGWSPTMAEQMASMFYAFLVSQMVAAR